MGRVMATGSFPGIELAELSEICTTVAKERGWSATSPSDRKLELRRGSRLFGAPAMVIWLSDTGDAIALTCEGPEAEANEFVAAVEGQVAGNGGSREQAAPSDQADSPSTAADGPSAPTTKGAAIPPVTQTRAAAGTAVSPAGFEPTISRAIRNGAKPGIAYVLSALLPGLGHLYMQVIVGGAVIFIGQIAALVATYYFATVIQVTQAADALAGTPEQTSTGNAVGILLSLAAWFAIWIGALIHLSSAAKHAREAGIDN